MELLMRVGFISQWLESNGNGLVGGIAAALADRGARVTAVVGTSIDSGGPPPWHLQKFKQTFPNYEARRYPYFRSQDGSAPKRALTYVTFSVVSGIGAVGLLRNSDANLVYSSPATAAWPAMVCRKLWGTPYVLLVQDLWPDSVFASGFITEGRVRKVAEWALGHFVDASYRNAATVVAISPGMKELLAARGVPNGKLVQIFNWADEAVMAEPVDRLPRVAGEPLELMYGGNLGFAQNLSNVIDAIAMMPPGSVRLTLVGEGAAEAELRRKAGSLAPGLVAFHPRVSARELRELMARAHMHLISLADEEAFRIAIPSKLQFLLAAGAPILCVAPGEVSGIVRTEEVGLTAVPEDLAELVKTLGAACELSPAQLDMMAERARTLYEAEMSEAINGEKLARLLEGAAKLA